MSVVAVLPVKTLASAKSRLADVLSAKERAALVLALMEQMLRVLRASEVITWSLVVSPDPLVLERATAAGAYTLLQQSGDGRESSRLRPPRTEVVGAIDGLNAALLAARRHIDSAKTLLVLLADLPLLTATDIRAMYHLLLPDGPAAVIAPDRHERGTNALLLRPPEALPFCFGRDSLMRHRHAARQAQLPLATYRAPGVAFDLDTPTDLGELEDMWRYTAKHQAGTPV
jgi:2-phospho-L-lactate guanylyltransferase